jgi:hypothetical protein
MKKLSDLVLLHRLDGLIRMKATGKPNELADRLGLSYSTMYETISFMQKTLNAPIRYDTYRQSFVYDYVPNFYLGFEKDRE